MRSGLLLIMGLNVLLTTSVLEGGCQRIQWCPGKCIHHSSCGGGECTGFDHPMSIEDEPPPVYGYENSDVLIAPPEEDAWPAKRDDFWNELTR